MTAYVHDSTFFTRRTIVLFAIIGLHVFIAWALATGLARRAMETLAPPIETHMIEEVKQRAEPPPPPPPQLERPPVEVPPPEVAIDIPVETQSTAIQDVTDRPVPRPPPPRPTSRTGVSTGKNFPNTQDYYPPASQRLGEEGTVNVRACVGANGKLTEDPTVAQSSGTARLDEGALKLAKAGSGKYVPATEDGKPVNSCFVFRIKFQLQK
ncbi:MAG: energy transducer TonB [Gammaproteobacteria bacterium]|nr:MAG: energy transducer TonB [Gammaproteobacteria bacterium]TLY80528.1 MAG: energy transducer TonB [Gammaproteobacteria bacterium]